MFYNRNWNLSEEEDFSLNIAPKMGKDEAATPLYDIESVVIGWTVKFMYE